MPKTKPMYLDYAAATPIDPDVLRSMVPYLKGNFGNPSSMHSFGQKAMAAIEKARSSAAKFLNCELPEIIFTSCATEANNLAIRGVIQNTKYKIQDTKPHIVTSQIEHESVLAPCQQLEAEAAAEVTYVPVTKEGIVRSEEIEKALKENTVLVSIMYANSEIGTIQPIAEIGAMLRELKTKNYKLKTVFHTDAVQAENYVDCDVQKLGVDLLTLSSHKMYGPKGAGVLYVKKGTPISALLLGGGQEGGLRSGTENVPSIVGMGKAMEEIQPFDKAQGENPKSKIQTIRIRHMRDRLIKGILKNLGGVELNGGLKERLPNNVNLRIKGIEGKDLVIALDQKGIAISRGSACSERSQEPSHVLLAIGLTLAEAMSSVRITLGKYTSSEDIDRAIHVIGSAVARLRRDMV